MGLLDLMKTFTSPAKRTVRYSGMWVGADGRSKHTRDALNLLFLFFLCTIKCGLPLPWYIFPKIFSREKLLTTKYCSTVSFSLGATKPPVESTPPTN